MKTVLFIPTYWYTSKSYFKVTSQLLKNNVEKVIIDVKDPWFYTSKDEGNKINFYKTYFDDYFFVQYPKPFKIRLWHMLKVLIFMFKLNLILRKIRPDLIITTGDRNNFYSKMKFLCPNIPIVIIQGALVHTFYYTKND